MKGRDRGSDLQVDVRLIRSTRGSDDMLNGIHVRGVIRF